MFLPEKGYKRIVIITFYIFLFLLFTYFFFKYLFSCSLPFLLAYILATASRKITLFLCEKFKFTRFFAVLSVTLLTLFILMTFIYVLSVSIFSEISNLSSFLTREKITNTFSGIYNKLILMLSDYFPNLLQKLEPKLSSLSAFINSTILSVAESLIPAIAQGAIYLLKLFPKLLLFSGVTILSLFYFGCDYESVNSFILKQLSKRQIKFLCELKNQVFKTIFNIIRAYAILILITFSELLCGFLLLGIPYATILAILISIIDILPILGTGTVLLPWSIILLLNGDTKNGISIIALYIIITVIRQIAEPKIIGSSLGLHPLLTLISMYFGIKLAGVSGLFIFPFVTIIIKNLNENGSIRLYKNPE